MIPLGLVGVSHWIEIEVEEAAAAVTFMGREGAASDVVSFTSTAVPAAMVTARTEKVYLVNGCKFSTVTDVLVLGKLMVRASSWS